MNFLRKRVARRRIGVIGMTKAPTRIAIIADRFRDYAAQCRAFAETDAGRPLAARLLAQAEQWEKDALIAESEAARIASCPERGPAR